MATQTLDKKQAFVPGTATVDPLILDPEKRHYDDEGNEIRYERVDGEWVGFSLKPYPEDQRPLYWNPIYPGGEMRWKSPHLNALGFNPTIQKERWVDGKFQPRNAWEEHMTRTWMVLSLPGCNNPDLWKGVNHPEGPEGEWRCQCSWHTGNWQAFHAHRRYLRHQESMSDFA